jgi:hypothetical protein
MLDTLVDRAFFLGRRRVGQDNGDLRKLRTETSAASLSSSAETSDRLEDQEILITRQGSSLRRNHNQSVGRWSGECNRANQLAPLRA